MPKTFFQWRSISKMGSLYCYCLFCETNKCKKVALLLQKNGIECAFSPQIVNRQRKNGVNIEVLYDLLPGYVFAYNSERIAISLFLKTNGVIRILGSPSENHCLEGNDFNFAKALLDRNGIIDTVRIFRVGDKVMLKGSLFSDVEGKVARIDYRKQRVKIEFSFDGVQCGTWVACDILNI